MDPDAGGRRLTAAERAILHVDLDAFFASVEQRDRPELRGRPVVVGGSGPRGVVAAASYEARVHGVRSAMPTAIARRRCPGLVVVRGDFARYRADSSAVFAILDAFTPIVQPVSIDEAYLDVTGSRRLHGTPREIAARIRARIRAEVGLVASIGIAPNRLVAKLASDLEKPDALVEIRAEELPDRLAPLSLERLQGVGPKSLARLAGLGLRTFGDLQRLDDAAARGLLGATGPELRRRALGLDDRPVRPDGAARSIGHERTFGVDLESPAEARAVLTDLLESAAARLRRCGRAARVVVVKIRFGDYETITRSETLADPTDRTDRLLEAAHGLYDRWAAERFRPVRLIGGSLAGLVDAAEAPAGGLFDLEEGTRRRALDATTDRIRDRFGGSAIGRAGWRRGAGTLRRDGSPREPEDDA